MGLDARGQIPSDTPTRIGIQDRGQIDKLASQADVGEIGHPDDIRSIRCSTVEEIGRDREVVMRIRRVNNMPFQMTQQGPFTPDPEHMLMVDLPSISL